jgi:hypothetical protein
MPTRASSAIPPAPGRWVLAARCRDANPALFFPSRGGSSRPAASLCAGCPVRADCQSYADAHRLPGVWAGTTHRAADTTPAALPAPPRTPRGALQAAVDTLAAHPGRWARVGRWSSPHSAGACASRLRPPPGVDPSRFTLRVVTNADHSLLYARVD